MVQSPVYVPHLLFIIRKEDVKSGGETIPPFRFYLLLRTGGIEVNEVLIIVNEPIS